MYLVRAFQEAGEEILAEIHLQEEEEEEFLVGDLHSTLLDERPTCGKIRIENFSLSLSLSFSLSLSLTHSLTHTHTHLLLSHLLPYILLLL